MAWCLFSITPLNATELWSKDWTRLNGPPRRTVRLFESLPQLETLVSELSSQMFDNTLHLNYNKSHTLTIVGTKKTHIRSRRRHSCLEFLHLSISPSDLDRIIMLAGIPILLDRIVSLWCLIRSPREPHNLVKEAFRKIIDYIDPLPASNTLCDEVFLNQFSIS